MTREEALRGLEFILDHSYNDETKEIIRFAIKALERSTDNEKALSGRLSDRDRIIQIIEGHKGCQTQVNLVLAKIIKEIEVLL